MNAREPFSSSFFAALHQASLEQQQAKWRSLSAEQQELVRRIIDEPQTEVDRLVAEALRAIDKADNE